MENSQTILADLYNWCFSVDPDTINEDAATSADGSNIVSIYQSMDPNSPNVWCVNARSESYNITSFEDDLSVCIDNFKQAWTNKDNPI